MDVKKLLLLIPILVVIIIFLISYNNNASKCTDYETPTYVNPFYWQCVPNNRLDSKEQIEALIDQKIKNMCNVCK